jgi:hypothetical protein
MDSETAEEIKRHFDVVADGLRAEVRDLRQHTDVGMRELRSELRAEIQDVKRHSDVIAESLRGEIRIVAEGVAGLDEKFTHEFRNVRQEIGEVKSLVRLSYGDLDRRVQRLEKAKPS